ncbi:sensor histidine kinase [Metabacillus sp. GX 13764]|uniref:cache domain-containing sensor histidine kinase n=1 Tax=Metabacillus kandeliae TaxID=2900151 RepID=UPI001E28A72F|nr:sensor histidine kinase [Metabacillus kandeliae]MCD7036351.1 sensor histidine kinase [Metabacillus kandeliae]
MKMLIRMPNYSIKQKIMLLALFSALIPLLVIGPFTFLYFNKIVENKVSTSVTNLLDITDWNINMFAGDLEDISNIIFLSNDIEGYLTYRRQDARLYQLETLSRNTLNSITVVNKPYINSIFIGNRYHSFVKVNRGEANLAGDRYKLLRESEIFPKLMNSAWEGKWFYETDTGLTGNKETPLLFGRVIRDLSTNEPLGVLLISINHQVFQNMFNDIQFPGSIVIYDGRSQVYTKGSKKVVEDPLLIKRIEDSHVKGADTAVIQGKKYIVNYHTNKKTGWKIVSMIPYQNLVKEIDQVRAVVISLLAGSLLISLTIAVFISRRITRELGLLRQVTERMERRHPIQGILFNTNGEIGKIGSRFVELYNRNNELSEKLFLSEVKEKEAELKALQSHINPHFLYNTLNSIYWMAEKSNAKAIAKMAISLSKIFRLTLNDGNPITTVQNELTQVESYLQIQNIRFDQKINYQFLIDEEILQEKIIKLLLQPIVENAAYHGLEPENGRGHILIEGIKRGDQLIFFISDDGKGFDTKSKQKKGYGLRNIDERLKLKYGNQFGLSIVSEPNKGTTVILKAGLHK